MKALACDAAPLWHERLVYSAVLNNSFHCSRSRFPAKDLRRKKPRPAWNVLCVVKACVVTQLIMEADSLHRAGHDAVEGEREQKEVQSNNVCREDHLEIKGEREGHCFQEEAREIVSKDVREEEHAKNSGDSDRAQRQEEEGFKRNGKNRNHTGEKGVDKGDRLKEEAMDTAATAGELPLNGVHEEEHAEKHGESGGAVRQRDEGMEGNAQGATAELAAYEEECAEKHGGSDGAVREKDEGTEGNAEEQEENEQPTKPLSKNAQKRLLKMERYRAQKMQRKAYEKSKRHEETEKKREEWETKLASLSAEEQEKVLKEKMERRQLRKENWQSRKDKLRRAMESGQNLVLDLEFCDRMKPNELVSLVQQVMYSYAANAKAAIPARLSLTGCAGDILSHFEKVSGFSNWLIHKEAGSYVDVFQDRKDNLVYLTADSEHTIDHLDESKIYIIGGLVDRNRWKGLTFEKAKSQGIATAKLPITKYLKMISSPVLTVNQVVEIILCFLEVKDWEEAMRRVIPLRKRSSEDVHDGNKEMKTMTLQQGAVMES